MTNPSYYTALRGSYVIISTRSTSFIGKLERDTHETLTLRPSIVHEPQVELKGGILQNMPHYRLEQLLPTIINTLEVQAVQSTTEQHVMKIVNYNLKDKLKGDKK